MTALAKVNAAKRIADPLEVLRIRAEVRAWLWWKWQMEMDESVDPLQAFAERSGLIALFGQDKIQAEISAPFARLRAISEAEEQAFLAGLEAKQSPPLAPALPADQPRHYRTPRATEDAFWFVVRQDDAERLSRWLAEHPRDAAHLHQIWKSKHAVA